MAYYDPYDTQNSDPYDPNPNPPDPTSTPPPATTPPATTPPPTETDAAKEAEKKRLYGNKDAFKAWILSQPGKTVADLNALLKQGIAELFGVKMGGSKGDKAYGPDGTYWADVVKSAGTGGDGFYWGEGGGSGDSGGESAFDIDPSYLAPFEGTPPTIPDATPFDPGPGFSYADFEGFDPFTAPTGDSILQDPSFQFRRDQGAGVLQNSAAARGLLNSGGTLKDLLNYGQNFASQEYGNIFDRDINLWDKSNQNKLTGYQTNRTNAADMYASNYGRTKDQATWLKDANDDAYNRAWSQFGDMKDTFYKNQTNPFNKQLSLAQLGLAGATA